MKKQCVCDGACVCLQRVRDRHERDSRHCLQLVYVRVRVSVCVCERETLEKDTQTLYLK